MSPSQGLKGERNREMRERHFQFADFTFSLCKIHCVFHISCSQLLAFRKWWTMWRKHRVWASPRKSGAEWYCNFNSCSVSSHLSLFVNKCACGWMWKGLAFYAGSSDVNLSMCVNLKANHDVLPSVIRQVSMTTLLDL